jgi:hypothetical protein
VLDQGDLERALGLRPTSCFALDLFEYRAGHDAAFAGSVVVWTKNTGMLRGRRPATIQCGPTRRTTAMDAAGWLLLRRGGRL